MTEALLHGRYRVVQRNRGAPSVAIDVETEQRVLLPEDVLRPGTFLWKAGLRAAARAVRDRGDPRLTLPLSVSPVVLPCPAGCGSRAIPESPAGLGLGTAELVTVVLEVIELMAIAGACGSGLGPWQSTTERQRDRVRVGLIAPLGHGYGGREGRAALVALETLERWLGRGQHFFARPERVTTDAPSPELLAALKEVSPYTDHTHPDFERVYPVPPAEAIARIASHASDPHAADAALAAVAHWDAVGSESALDLDEAVTMGEAELAEVTAPDDAWHARRVRFDLAGVLHRRACLAGSLDRAIADATRASEIDPHPEHVTTLALFHERGGDRAAAAAAHDRAVAAIARVTPGSPEESVYADFYRPGTTHVRDIDYRESLGPKVARTLECRGAFRATQGDRPGAIDDLRASLAMCPSPSAARRLARLGA